MLFKIKNKAKERSLQIEFNVSMKICIAAAFIFSLLFGGVDPLPVLSEIDIASTLVSSILPNEPNGG